MTIVIVLLTPSRKAQPTSDTVNDRTDSVHRARRRPVRLPPLGQALGCPDLPGPALPRRDGPLDPLLTDGLAEGREVILFNGRGIASSSGTPRNRIEDMADDIAAVIRALGLEQVDLLGFSIGGFQVQEVTLRHPQLVRKLLLLGTGLRGGDPTSDPQVPDHALNPVHVLENFLFLFFGRSDAAVEAGRAFRERLARSRADQDTPSLARGRAGAGRSGDGPTAEPLPVRESLRAT